MSETLPADPFLATLKAELTKLYGPRLKQILLYGSRARGDQRENSDYDVLVVLDPPLDYWAEVHVLSGLSSQLLWDTIHRKPPVDVYFKPVTSDRVQARTGFLHNVRREAISL
jgi:uncharacterized protein